MDTSRLVIAALVLGACAADAQDGDAGAASGGNASSSGMRAAVPWECSCKPPTGAPPFDPDPVCFNRAVNATFAAEQACGPGCTCTCCAASGSCRTDEPEKNYPTDACAGPGMFCSSSDSPDPNIDDQLCNAQPSTP